MTQDIKQYYCKNCDDEIYLTNAELKEQDGLCMGCYNESKGWCRGCDSIHCADCHGDFTGSTDGDR